VHRQTDLFKTFGLVKNTEDIDRPVNDYQFGRHKLRRKHNWTTSKSPSRRPQPIPSTRMTVQEFQKSKAKFIGVPKGHTYINTISP
jgi:hypothetical protein